ncbi:MAG: tRNA threonylcarbamoyladenosine dehydratase [Lachnospiraceae bacterium]|nr:tRNA threonylcarbamoyladenosine dehydratase [Lachnospiraceae bacterium]
MSERFSRTELLLGKEAIERLASSRVAIFGTGGVGGYVCEALARSGVGSFDLIDNDNVSLSNINRQIIATTKTVGKLKVDVMKERILDINPDAIIITHNCFFLPENADEFQFEEYDYVVDAVDTVAAKIALAVKCQEAKVPIISSMGAGNKLDPTSFVVTDIYKTKMDPLARVMRRELKNRNVKKLKVVYSEEKPLSPKKPLQEENSEISEGLEDSAKQGYKRRSIPGSVAFVPSVAGLIIASEVVKDLIKC